MRTLRTHKYAKTKQTSITAQTIKNKIKVNKFLQKKEANIKKSYVNFDFSIYSDMMSYGMSSSLRQLEEITKDLGENSPIKKVIETLTELEKMLFKSNTGIDIDEITEEYTAQKKQLQTEHYNKTRADKDPNVEVIINRTQDILDKQTKKTDHIVITVNNDEIEK